MASYEGAMLGGVLLPREEFIDLMIRLLKEHKDNIYSSLEETQSKIAQNNIKEAYKAWDQFQTKILMNPTTSLLAILNFSAPSGSGRQQWTFIDNEDNAIAKSGLINVQSVSKSLRRSYCSDILAQHLSNLFKEVASEMEADEVNYLYDLNRKDLFKRLNPIKYGDKRYIYKVVIYGNIMPKYYAGKVADAYLNHLGATHYEYLNNFSQGNLDGLEHLRNASVKNEERAINILNFVHLLMASTNRTAWYTGGDLIVTNKNGEIVANIQLKISMGEGKQIGNIKTATLNNEIEKIKEIWNMDNKTIAEKFYEVLKTSAVLADVGDAIISEGYKIAENNLKLNGITTSL